MYTLIGSDGKPYQSTEKGTIGGHKRLKIYGRLDCANANQMIAKGHYVKHRVFFADEATAIEAGYRPCGKCMKDRHNLWKQALAQASGDAKQARANYRSLVKCEIDLAEPHYETSCAVSAPLLMRLYIASEDSVGEIKNRACGRIQFLVA